MRKGMAYGGPPFPDTGCTVRYAGNKYEYKLINTLWICYTNVSYPQLCYCSWNFFDNIGLDATKPNRIVSIFPTSIFYHASLLTFLTLNNGNDLYTSKSILNTQ